MKINKKQIACLSALFLLLLVVFLLNLIFSPAGSEIEAKLFTIEKGQTAKEIAASLQSEGLIKDKYAFFLYAILSNKHGKMQAGEYLLSPQMSTSHIITLFTSGETKKEKLTVIEGWDLRDIADYLQSKGLGTKDDFYAITGKPAGENENPDVASYDFLGDKPLKLSIEGYLFPDTYYIDKSDTLKTVVDKMLKNFNDKLTDDLKAEIKKQDKSVFEIITMASMIEKEVRTMEDKKIVAGILWKRIKNNTMRLQVDATILYAEDKVGLKIYTKDTQINSPYNTYKVDGLPLGPICNPGMNSILAAIYPTETKYWYYLSARDGTTIFSKTLEEHNTNKARYLK